MEFAAVREAVGVSDSVLSKHVKQLEDAGYVQVRKATVASRQRTSLSLTRAGRAAFEAHVAELRRITGGWAAAQGDSDAVRRARALERANGAPAGRVPAAVPC